MKVVFYVSQEESDVYEMPDNMTSDQLEAAAFDWMNNNVGAYYEVIEDDE